MKRTLVVPMLAMVLTSLAAAQPRVDRVIDTQWRFTRANPAQAESPAFDDSSWEVVNLPHT